MNNKIRFNFCLCIFIVLLNSCNSASEDGSCIVSGTIENYKKAKLQLFEITQSLNYFVTKIEVEKDGSFKVKFDAKEKSIYGIRSQNSFIYFINDVPEIIIRTSENEFENYFTEQSPQTEELRQLVATEKKMATEVTLAEKLLFAKMVKTDSKIGNDPELLDLENKSDKNELELRNYITNYMDTVNDKLLAIAASSFLKMNEDYNYLERFNNKIKNADVNSKQKRDLNLELEKIKESFQYIAPLKKIKAIDINGKERTMDSLQNKYIFLNIWASWCYTSREQMPYIMNVYEKYKNDPRIEFINIAINDNIRQWKDFLQKQSYTMKNNLCDTLGKEAAILKRFGLDYIPANFLLDKQGSIITSNLKSNDIQYTIDSIIKAGK